MHIYSFIGQSILAVNLLLGGFEPLTTTTAPQWVLTDNSDQIQFPPTTPGGWPKKRPLVIWHGLGDNYNSSEINKVKEIYGQMHPNMYILSIGLDESPIFDERRSIMGNPSNDIEYVCEMLTKNGELDNGFDAMGFSQGGLFLRALVQRCPGISVHNLVTFGSPHMGVLDLPLCSDPGDWICKRRNEYIKRNIWNDAIQRTVVPAQYFRDPNDMSKYLEKSHLLADLNNERTINTTYVTKLQALNALVLISFESDTTLVPKYSSKFYDISPETGKLINYKTSVPFVNLGLSKLDKEDRIHFYSLPGEHMEIPEPFFVVIGYEFFGGYPD